MCKRLFHVHICWIVILLFSMQSFAQDQGNTIAFSLDDYEKSIQTGAAIRPHFIPVQTDSIDNWPSDVDKPKADNSFSISEYIIGGNNASRNEYPEYTLVLITDGLGSIIGFCGGTLIARNKVLTAAHCAQLPANRYLVIPDFYSFNDTVVASDFFEVLSVVDHPNYDNSTSDSDIAVLTLERNASSATASVHAGTDKFVDSLATVIGTGRIQTNPATYSDILQEVDVPIVSNKICNEAWDSLAGITPITRQMMCAGFSTNGRGGCFGDSGGPLWTDIDGQRALVGTVSFGFGTCEDNRQSAVYARAGALNNFLASQSPETNFILSNDFNLAPMYNLLFDDSPPPPPPPPIDPAALYPPIAEPTSQKYVLLLESAFGEYIGMGRSYSYSYGDEPIFSITLQDDKSILMVLEYDQPNANDLWLWIWRMEVTNPGDFREGEFSNTARFANLSPTGYGLDFNGSARFCSQSSGRFRIFEIEYSGSQVAKLVADFIQYCDGDTAPLKGSIHYDSSKP